MITQLERFLNNTFVQSIRRQEVRRVGNVYVCDLLVQCYFVIIKPVLLEKKKKKKAPFMILEIVSGRYFALLNYVKNIVYLCSINLHCI